MKETIQVEKEVYDAVLRNSVKVADLEAENMQLRQFCEGFNTLEVSEENQKLKELLEDCKRVITEDIVFNHKGDMSDSYAEILSRIDEVLQ